jgi:hypothetical protein
VRPNAARRRRPVCPNPRVTLKNDRIQLVHGCQNDRETDVFMRKFGIAALHGLWVSTVTLSAVPMKAR